MKRRVDDVIILNGQREGLVKKIVRTLLQYIQSQMVVMLVVTIVVWLVLSTLNVQFTLLIAIVSGVCATIPFVGTLISALLAALVAVFDSTRFLPNAPVVVEGIVIALFYIVLNIIVDYVLSPLLVARITHVHPLILIASVVAGTAVLGIAGTFISVPTVLVVKTILEHFDTNKK